MDSKEGKSCKGKIKERKSYIEDIRAFRERLEPCGVTSKWNLHGSVVG